MENKRKYWALTALLTVALVVATMCFPPSGFAQAQDEREAQLADSTQALSISGVMSQKAPDARTGLPKMSAPSIQMGYGLTDSQAGIFLCSHESESTVYNTIGYQLTVEADCQDLAGYGKYAAYFGLWDNTLKEYVQYFNSDLIVDNYERWYAVFDLSKLTISSGRYEVDVILYDTVTSESQAYDYFMLDVVGFSPASISSATASGPHSVLLTMRGGNGDAGFLLYKATAPAGPYVYVGKAEFGALQCNGLISGKTYYFKMRQYCTGGATTKYGPFSGYVAGIARPLAPEIDIPAIAYTSQKISWWPVSGGNGYYIYRATAAAGPYTYVGSTTGSYFISTGLITGKTYYYKLKTYHTESNGTKVFSYYSVAKSAKAVPGKPSVRLTLVSQNAIKLTWTAITGAHGYDIYRIQTPYYQPEMTMTKIATVGATTLTYTNSGLLLNANYYYVVRAYHIENGVKIYSPTPAESGQTTPSHATLGAPVVTANPSYDRIYVEWEPMEGATHYELYWYGEDYPERGYIYSRTLEGSYSDNAELALSPSVKYTIRVRPYHLEGTVKIYGTSGYSQPTYIAPSQPNYIYVSANSPTSVRIMWTGAYTSTGYRLERSSDNVNFTLLSTQASTAPLEYIDATCEPGQTYYYRVAGYNQKSDYPGQYKYSGAVTTPLE